jgi:hypothetical protein
MSNLPIAAMFARDAVERQFQPGEPRGRRAAAGGKVAAAAVLRGLADRLDPRPVRAQAARRANPATHRGSPC